MVSQLLNCLILDQIYTNIGDILLAVNPFTHMDIYTSEVTLSSLASFDGFSFISFFAYRGWAINNVRDFEA